MKALALPLRARLMTVIGVAIAALATIFATDAFLTTHVSGELATIERRYVPRVELEPQLESAFERLRRGFQDAVAIHDAEALSATRDLRTKFLEQLGAASEAIDPREAGELRAAFDDYYIAAYDVSRRVIDGETGEGLVDAVAATQKRQAEVERRIKVVAALDRQDLAAAFRGAARSARLAGQYGLAIGAACVTIAVFLSLRLGREVLRELQVNADKANAMAESLERLGAARTRAERALADSNRELEIFSYTVAHDLRAPLRAINGFSRALQEDCGDKLDDESRDHLHRIAAAAQRMGELIDSLLSLVKLSRAEIRPEKVDVTRLAELVAQQLRTLHPDHQVAFHADGGLVAYADRPLLQGVLENLMGNAWKFTGGRPNAVVRFGSELVDGEPTYFVRDNGAGFDMAYAAKLFTPFQRLHKASEFAGTGIGLATVQRIVARHGGRVWAKGTVGEGATFYFTLPTPVEGANA
jgi:signal transduction histidine kinase